MDFRGSALDDQVPAGALGRNEKRTENVNAFSVQLSRLDMPGDAEFGMPG